ncbi:MAG: diguanylate cyclase [Hydrogenophilus sp.]|nr:diguanylate cyclase [Hydrogenophilus sp.]
MASPAASLPLPSLSHSFPYLSVILALLLAAATLITEYAWWQIERNATRATLQRTAFAQTDALLARLHTHAERLRLIGEGILGRQLRTEEPLTLEQEQALQRLAANHEALRALIIVAADGNRLWWSTFPNATKPIFTTQDLQPALSAPDAPPLLLSLPRFAARLGETVVGARIPILHPDGTVAFYVGAPYSAHRLFAPPQPDASPHPIAITDQRYNVVVSLWHPNEGLIILPALNERMAGADDPAHLPTTHCRAPYCVTTWLVTPFSRGYLYASAPRWLLEAALLALATWLIAALQRALHSAHNLNVQLRAAYARERSLARLDPLTGLANRVAFEETAERLITIHNRSGAALAIGILDLDDFKPINDRFGYEAGDHYLTLVAERLAAVVPPPHLIARLGGDEFALILVELPLAAPREELSAFMGRLQQSLDQPLTLAGETLPAVSYRLGWAIYPLHGAVANDLLRRAEEQLIALKKNRNSRKWSVVGDEIVPQPIALDPYGGEAAKLLTAYAAPLSSAFSDAHDEMLSPSSDLSPSASSPPPSTDAPLFHLLLTPDLTSAQLTTALAQAGTDAALDGRAPWEIVEPHTRRLLRALTALQGQGLLPHDLLRLFHTLLTRHHHALAAQLGAYQQVYQAYCHFLLAQIPSPTLPPDQWGSALVAAAAHLPGLGGAALVAPQWQTGTHLLSIAPADQADHLHHLLTQTPHIPTHLVDALASGHPHIVDLPALSASLAAVPLFVADRGLLLLLIGKAPGQFTTPLARLFLEHLALRLRQTPLSASPSRPSHRSPPSARSSFSSEPSSHPPNPPPIP